MGFQILQETFSELIRKNLTSGRKDIYLDDVFKEQLKNYTPSQFRAMLFYVHFLCLANVESNQIKEIALLVIPEVESKLAGIQISAMTFATKDFFEYVISNAKDLTKADMITKLFAYINGDSEFYSSFLHFNFIQDFQIQLPKYKRIHFSYFL